MASGLDSRTRAGGLGADLEAVLRDLQRQDWLRGVLREVEFTDGRPVRLEHRLGRAWRGLVHVSSDTGVRAVALGEARQSERQRYITITPEPGWDLIASQTVAGTVSRVDFSGLNPAATGYRLEYSVIASTMTSADAFGLWPNGASPTATWTALVWTTSAGPTRTTGTATLAAFDAQATASVFWRGSIELWMAAGRNRLAHAETVSSDTGRQSIASVWADTSTRITSLGAVTANGATPAARIDSGSEFLLYRRRHQTGTALVYLF